MGKSEYLIVLNYVQVSVAHVLNGVVDHDKSMLTGLKAFAFPFVWMFNVDREIELREC